MQNEQPLVSIIVITYNSEKYVLETLESAKAQTYQNIELIVSDDGSTDSTVEICRKWIEENKDRFVRAELLTVEKNTGIPANCNRGVISANGEWIKFIAADDMLYESAILDYIQYSVEHIYVDLMYSFSNRYIEVFSESNFFGIFPSCIPLYFVGDNISAERQYLMLLRGNIINTPTVFLKKRLIIEVGGFDESFKFLEDYPMWLKLTRAGHKFHFMPKVTVKHRYHKNATDSFISNQLFKSNYFLNESFRKVYVYPNLNIIEKCMEQYKYYLRKVFNHIGLNKKIYICIIIDLLFTKYLNPFVYLNYFYRFYCKNKITSHYC